MKLTATKENLLFGVNAVQKAVSTKTTLPILSCIKLEAKEGTLYFSATDLEIGIQCHLPAEVIFEGAIVVPARYFQEIVRKLPDTIITLKLQGTNDLIIEYENSQMTLKTLPADDFPSIPDVVGKNEVNIQGKVLKHMVKQTVFASGTDEARPLFTGILCELTEGIFRMVATDTHRLALRQGNTLVQPEETLSFIIPAKMLSELARLINDEEEICYLNVTNNLASFRLSNIRIICRLLEGQFPNYRQVIPSQYKSKVFIKSKSLNEAVERISLFTMVNDNSKTIQMNIENNLLTVSSQSDLGQGYEQLKLDFEGEAVKIAFNSRYILDVLKVVDSDIVSLEFTGSLSPCIVRPAEDDNFLYLLLPVRS